MFFWPVCLFIATKIQAHTENFVLPNLIHFYLDGGAKVAPAVSFTLTHTHTPYFKPASKHEIKVYLRLVIFPSAVRLIKQFSS
jgi:hypothetical protein